MENNDVDKPIGVLNVSADGDGKTVVKLAMTPGQARRLVELFAKGEPVVLNGGNAELMSVEEAKPTEKKWAESEHSKRKNMRNESGHNLPD